MKDIIDRANEQAQRHRDAAIAAARLKTQAIIANDITDCIECEKPIGEQRKQYMPSATRCIPCQTEHEAWERRR